MIWALKLFCGVAHTLRPASHWMREVKRLVCGLSDAVNKVT